MSSRVYVGGTFDLFHSGHVELLRRAAKYGDVLVVLNSDEYAASFKERPVMNWVERMEVLQACRYVRQVILNTGQEENILSAFQPHYIVYAINGDEYTRESYLERLGIDEAFLEKHGMELVLIPYTPSPSTTEVIERVIQRRGGQPRERDRAPEDARQPDVPDCQAGRGHCACVRSDAGCPCRAPRGLSPDDVPFYAG